MSILNVNQIQPVGGGNTITVSANDVNFSGNISIQGLTGTADITVGNIQSGVVTATTFIGDGSGLTGVTASGSGINIKDSGSTVGVAATIDFSTNLNVSPASAGIVTVTVGDTDFAIADKIVHTGDTNTAIRFPAADTITAETGGSEKVRINSAGEVGIKNTSPESYGSDGRNLVIGNSDSNAASGITLVSGTGGYSTIYFADGTTGSELYSGTIVYNHSDDRMDFWTAGVRRLRITSAGNVGIASEIPEKQLVVRTGSGSDGGILVKPNISYANNQDRAYLIVATDSFGLGGSSWNDYGFQHRIKSNSSGTARVTIDTSGGEAFCVENGGQVGIGTNDPDASLHIHNNTSVSFDAICLSGSTKRQNLIKVNGADNLIVSVDEDNEGGDSQFRLQIDGSEKIRVNSSGRVGINTTDPQSSLEVFTDDDTDFGNSSNTNNTNSLIRLFNKNGTDNTAVNNYVGIRFDVANGATSSAWLSYLRTGNNTGAFQFKARNAASSYPEVARILSSGGITFNGDTAQANALNDYEEGTLDWRLQRTGAIGSGSNHSDTSVTYTKVGNRVYVSGYIYTSNTGGTTGVTVELRDNSNTNNVATLPYVPNQSGGFPITGTRTISDNYRNMAVTFRHGQAQVYIYSDDGDNAYLKNKNNVDINSAQTHLVIQFCGSYTTNS